MISGSLIDQIIEVVNSELLIALFSKAFRGYNRETLPIPINTIYLSFMPEQMKTSYFEDESSGTCKKTEFSLKMTVFAPATRRGAQVQAIAELVADYLSDIYMGELQEYTIGDISFDDGVNSLTLPTVFRFCYTECPLDSGDDLVSDVIPESFFCKSHVNNTTVHLNESDRNYLSSPFVIGSYTGNGDSAGLEINLGFRPKLLIVYRNSYHVSSYSTSDGVSNCYFGAAIGTTYTRGPLILDNGFRVKTVVTSSATTHLNDEGGNYTYIAFR